MKKFLSIIALAGLMTACADSATHDETPAADSSAMPMDTAAMMDTSSAMSSTPAMKDGLMTLKDGKVMVAKGGAWEPLAETVTTTNGRKVMPNGEVSKGDKKRMLTEGMMIDMDGQMMDKDGKMIDNTGWE